MTTTAGADRSRLAQVLASLLLVLPLGAALAAVLTWRDRLPDPLPRHWNLSGEMDGSSDLTAFTGIVVGALAVLTVVALVLVWAVRTHDVAGFSTSLTGGMTWFLAAVFVGTLAVSVDAARAEDVGVPVAGLVVGVVLGVAVAFALFRLVPALPAREQVVGPISSSLTFADDERVVWIGSASSRRLRWLGVVVAVVGALGVVGVGPGSLILLAVGVVVALTSTVTTRIDDHGVRVRWTALGLVGSRTPLADVVGVEVTQARPGEWGGWGFRVSPRGVAHLVRSGEAIVVSRRGRTDMLVTVDGAEQARDVLAGLLAREAARA